MHALDGPTTALELVKSFRQVRVLVIGDVMLDSYLEGEASRLCSEGPVPVVRKTQEQRLPGGAANSATNLHALEAEVCLLSIIGHDMAGTLLRSALAERGVSDRWLIEDEGASTVHKLRILADGHYVVRFDEGGERASATSPYSTQSQQSLLFHLEELYAQCNVVVISDYVYGVITDEVIARLCALQAAHPRIILIDSKALQRFRDLPATIVTPNYQEARLLLEEMARWERGQPEQKKFTGMDIQTRATLVEIEEMARQLLLLLATEHVAITLAEDGVLLLSRGEAAIHLPAHPVAHANDVGAGDSFIAALALALATGGGVQDAVQIGIDAAGIAVSKPRTAVVQYQELLQRVSLRIYAMQSQSKWESGEQFLVAQLEVERALGRTIVFTNGVFDILHAGHVQFLRQAKELGDVLVVGINSDSSVRRLKGSRRPINNEQDRLVLVAALDMVDHVILFDTDTPTALIRLLRPHIHVKGGDYAESVLPEAEAVREGGGRVVILPLLGSLSTTNVIERILTFASGKMHDTADAALHAARQEEPGNKTVHVDSDHTQGERHA